MLVNGDCLEEVQKLVDKGIQVDSIVTDPPYHLTSIVDRFGKASIDDDTLTSKKVRSGADSYSRLIRTGFMGKEWDGGDIAFRKETWELFMKVLKPGGHLLAFSGSRTYHRMAVAIEDAGFDIRDQIMWLYGSGFPKSHNLGDGWGTALKPAHEPIVLARKKIEGTNKQNREKYGTAGLNIDACRIEGEKQTRDSNPVMNGGKYGQNQNADREEITPDTMGRFPANVMHNGLEEDWARYYYCPKTSKAEKGKDNSHPTVKPLKLMKYLCRLITPKGGTVLDPFMGSGSTGIAAKDEGFDFIGIEREKEYFEIAERRVSVASPLEEFMK